MFNFNVTLENYSFNPHKNDALDRTASFIKYAPKCGVKASAAAINHLISKGANDHEIYSLIEAFEKVGLTDLNLILNIGCFSDEEYDKFDRAAEIWSARNAGKQIYDIC